MNTLAEQIFRRSLDAQKPSTVLRQIVGENKIRSGEVEIELDGFDGIYVVGSGKAAWEMVRTLCEEIGDRVAGALAVSPYDPAEEKESIQFHQAAHPVPDSTSISAAEKITSFMERVPENSLLLYAISGGTSSLVCQPAGDITVDELNQIYEQLNNCGANIHEINTVRKHISRVKGGQLLRHVDPAVTLLDLVISDVPNDDMQVIGSGPTTPDTSTFQDAYHILLEYKLWEKLPGAARKHIEEGIEGIVPETVKPGEDPVDNHISIIVGSAQKLAQKACELMEEAGYDCWVAPQAYNKDVAKVARDIADKVISVKEQQVPAPLPVAFIFYGESTVEVTGDGKGGRNQELALRGALEIAGYENITWLSAGTDGIDGPTDAAGAVVTGSTVAEAQEKGIDPYEHLKNNDAYHFHEAMGTLLKTGPTGNNLMDIQIVLVD
ncbi:glycerate kinase [Halalkalibaculum sp. DA3122]|uniref:glycerate kinase type-2 family protein n=1 Tax=unclassified Halalkalibaculum TaxID=2964617 RepID=UPI003753F31E